MDHIKGRESNLRLQRSIKKKIWLKSFNILLTEIETSVISAFPFSSLFNKKTKNKKVNSM